MSRHEIKLGKHPNLEITVGWDNPLQTYFVIIKDNSIDEDYGDPIILWAGASLHELYEIDDLQKVMREYAVLVADLRQKLYADKDEGR